MIILFNKQSVFVFCKQETANTTDKQISKSKEC